MSLALKRKIHHFSDLLNFTCHLYLHSSQVDRMLPFVHECGVFLGRRKIGLHFMVH